MYIRQNLLEENIRQILVPTITTMHPYNKYTKTVSAGKAVSILISNKNTNYNNIDNTLVR